MAHVDIGMTEILLPADLAAKLIDLLTNARICRASHFPAIIKAGGPLAVEMRLLHAGVQIIDTELDENGFELRAEGPAR